MKSSNKLSDFILRLQEVEHSNPGGNVRFYVRFKAGGTEVSEELFEQAILNTPCSVTFSYDGH